MAVILTQKQTVEVVRQVIESEGLEKIISSGVLRVHKDANEKVYKLEFVNIDITSRKELVAKFLPEEDR